MQALRALILIFTLSAVVAIQIPSRGAPAFDGRGRNLGHVEYGSTGAPLLRFGDEPIYDDDIGEYRKAISGDDLPSPRLLSENVFGRGILEADKQVDNAGRTLLLGFFGQLLDHDITLTTESAEARAFLIPANDRFFDPFNTGLDSTHSFDRSTTTPGTGVNSPREFTNAITSWIDASFIYGSTDAVAAALRGPDGTLLAGATVNKDGFMQSPAAMLPKDLVSMDNARGRATPAELFSTGDVRGNENPALTALHTVFFREHNRKVQEMKDKNECSGNEDCFQKARLWLGGLMQAIVAYEYLPALTGQRNPLGAYEYREDVNPNIAAAFSTAAFRFGHTQIGPILPLLGRDGKAEGALLLRDVFFLPQAFDKTNGISSILRGLAAVPMEELDSLVIGDLRNHLFALHGGALGMDLIARNIARGRDHGILTYAGAVEYYLGTTYTSLDDTTDDQDFKNVVKATYQDERDIDLFVGMLGENKVSKYSSFGPLLDAMIIDQFTRTSKSDWYWFENTANGIFSAAELKELKNTRLIDIFVRNTNIRYNELPTYSFFADKPLLEPSASSNNICKHGRLDEDANTCTCFNSALKCVCDMSETKGTCNCGNALECQATTDDGTINGGNASVVLALYTGATTTNCENAESCSCATMSSNDNGGRCYKQNAIGFKCMSPAPFEQCQD